LIGTLSERDLTMFCLALYAGEGSKTEGAVKFANTSPTLSRVFITWLRRVFDVDETRLRVTLYLHSDLDLDMANEFWSSALSVPIAQFPKPYRAPADATIRTNRHIYGCATIGYSCRLTHRRVMAMIEAVTSPFALPG
jgi:hypothetical protein